MALYADAPYACILEALHEGIPYVTRERDAKQLLDAAGIQFFDQRRGGTGALATLRRFKRVHPGAGKDRQLVRAMVDAGFADDPRALEAFGNCGQGARVP